MYETDYSYAYQEVATSGEFDFMGGAVFAGFMVVYFMILVAVIAVSVVSMWKLFDKAGKPGWAAVVPVYNTIVALELSGRPWWWVLLLFVPFVSVIFAVIFVIDFVKSYGKDTVYGILTLLFPYIMLPILAFSKDTEYVGPAGPDTIATVS